MIELLRPYPAIAWDFDNTLIGSPNSPLIHAFIHDNPHKRHCIITFRSHGYERSIFRELASGYPDAPKRDAFDMVYNIEDRAWEEFEKIAQLRIGDAYEGPPTVWETYFYEWKARTARENDLPVLVDDMREQVIEGCEKYHIAYFHPDNL